MFSGVERAVGGGEHRLRRLAVARKVSDADADRDLNRLKADHEGLITDALT